MDAWDIAHVVEHAAAADRVRIRGLRRGQNRRAAIASEYDPLAATCLALLIEDKLVRTTTASSVGTEGALAPVVHPNPAEHPTPVVNQTPKEMG